MPPAPLVPDDVWSHVISYLAPAPPVLMASTPPSLLADVLERWRAPDKSKEDLLSFSRVSKRLKTLSERSLYAYLFIPTKTVCGKLAVQLHRWTEAKSPILSYIVGIALSPDATAGHTELIQGARPFAYILEALKNLSYLHLGGRFAVSPDVLLALMADRPAVRCLRGVGISSTNYRPVAGLLDALGGTLESVSLFEAEDLEAIHTRQTPWTVSLPSLLHLDLSALRPESLDVSPMFLHGWRAPVLRTVTVNMEFVSPSIGEGFSMKNLQCGLESTIEEYTCLMDVAADPGLYRRLELFAKLNTLALHLSEDPLWQEERAQGHLKHFGITTLIFVQETWKTGQMRSADIARDIYPRLSRFASKATFPSLERVYYVTEHPDGHVWKLWSRIAVDLVKAGVDVVYL